MNILHASFLADSSHTPLCAMGIVHTFVTFNSHNGNIGFYEEEQAT